MPLHQSVQKDGCLCPSCGALSGISVPRQPKALGKGGIAQLTFGNGVPVGI